MIAIPARRAVTDTVTRALGRRVPVGRRRSARRAASAAARRSRRLGRTVSLDMGAPVLRSLDDDRGPPRLMTGADRPVAVDQMAGRGMRRETATMTNPDRRTWLAERRAAVRAEYDDEASTYDADEYPIPLHRAFVDRLLELTPAGGRVLDAPCGTGRWFAPIVESGRSVVGIDQSAGMLDQARRRGLAEALHQVGLQELTLFAEFEASMTIDAMENVPPE